MPPMPHQKNETIGGQFKIDKKKNKIYKNETDQKKESDKAATSLCLQTSRP
jgi:phage-related protein